MESFEKIKAELDKNQAKVDYMEKVIADASQYGYWALVRCARNEVAIAKAEIRTASKFLPQEGSGYNPED